MLWYQSSNPKMLVIALHNRALLFLQITHPSLVSRGMGLLPQGPSQWRLWHPGATQPRLCVVSVATGRESCRIVLTVQWLRTRHWSLSNGKGAGSSSGAHGEEWMTLLQWGVRNVGALKLVMGHHHMLGPVWANVVIFNEFMTTGDFF